MTYFEGFEHRAGVDRQQQSKLKTAKDPGKQSKRFPSTNKRHHVFI